jgi:hypothetical protein
MLMRLVLAMILVLAVMRQAGNPRIYEAFFPPSGVDTVAKAPATMPIPIARLGGDGVINGDGVPGIALDKTISGRLDQTLVELGDEQAAELMTQLGRWRTAGGVETPVLSEEWSDRLDDAFIRAGQSSDNLSGENASEPPEWTAAPILSRLQSALDRWAIARVDPAAVWKGVDTLGFYRLLEDDPGRRPDDAASRTSITSLVQQPDVYLRRRVVLPASVARAIRRTAAKNPFGVQDYWEVWLRPRDGSERPFVMFTREVSTAIAAIGPDAALTEGPPVWVDGVFLKRIAYQSSLGRELAPAIVGIVHEPSSDSSNLPTARTSPSSTEGWLLVAFSAVIGFSAAALVFFQSGKAIARSRALRQKTRPPVPPILASLDQADRRDRESEETLS